MIRGLAGLIFNSTKHRPETVVGVLGDQAIGAQGMFRAEGSEKPHKTK
jgi:hypothetical protein